MAGSAAGCWSGDELPCSRKIWNPHEYVSFSARLMSPPTRLFFSQYSGERRGCFVWEKLLLADALWAMFRLTARTRCAANPSQDKPCTRCASTRKTRSCNCARRVFRLYLRYISLSHAERDKTFVTFRDSAQPQARVGVRTYCTLKCNIIVLSAVRVSSEKRSLNWKKVDDIFVISDAKRR